MSLKKLQGTGEVFRFTFTQLLKSKGLITSLVIMILVALFAYPVKNIFSGDEEREINDTSIEKLLVIDETSLNVLDWFTFKDTYLLDRELPKVIEKTDKNYEEVVEQLKTTEEKVCLLRIRNVAEEGTFYFTFVRGANSEVNRSDVQTLSDALQSDFQKLMIKHMNLSNEQLELLNLSVETEVVYHNFDKEDADDESDNDNKGSSISLAQYTVTLVFLSIAIMLVSMCAEYISSSIVMEKSSRVVEFLLTSVRPMALLCGKVFAVLLIVVGQIVVMAFCAGISVLGYHALVTTGGISDGIEVIKGIFGVVSGVELQVSHIVIIIPLLVGGVLFYSMIGGVIAASVKSMEELQESMKTFTTILMIGSYASMAIVIVDLMGNTPEILRYIGYLLPFSSVYILPGYLVSGQVSLWVAVVALVILVVAVIFMFMFAARVYEYLMYYRGQKLKIRDYFRIYKQENGGKK